jgi:hypothetical protein
MPNLKHRQYLGDAVYASFDGYHIVLTTENGISETNRICLDPAVFNSLVHYSNKLIETLKRDSTRPETN